MKIPLRVSHFPWLDEAQEYLDAITFSQFLSDIEAKELAVHRVVNSVNNRTAPPYSKAKVRSVLRKPSLDTEEYTKILLSSYPAARIIVSIINDSRVTAGYASGEAKAAKERITSRGEEVSIDKKYVFEEFGIDITKTTLEKRFLESASQAWLHENKEDVKRENEFQKTFSEIFPRRFDDSKNLYRTVKNRGLGEPDTQLRKMSVSEYSNEAEMISGEEWPLYVSDVSGGSVFISPDHVGTILEQNIFERVKRGLPMSIAEEIVEAFGAYVERAEDRIDDSRFSYEIDRVEPGLFPPLVETLIERTRTGENLEHMERFTVASFLITIGMSDDEIVDMLGVSRENVPDFAEETTREQLEHIRTRGDGTGDAYSVPTYQTVESWGTTWEKDSLEQDVSHPLQYYEVKLKQDEE